ncbi:MAG: hypothetical protein L3J03_08455 [Desulfobacterales bacterium]|nr:hypothetical protein [Desulfobacterales bacterium]
MPVEDKPPQRMRPIIAYEQNIARYSLPKGGSGRFGMNGSLLFFLLIQYFFDASGKPGPSSDYVKVILGRDDGLRYVVRRGCRRAGEDLKNIRRALTEDKSGITVSDTLPPGQGVMISRSYTTREQLTVVAIFI